MLIVGILGRLEGDGCNEGVVDLTMYIIRLGFTWYVLNNF